MHESIPIGFHFLEKSVKISFFFLYMCGRKTRFCYEFRKKIILSLRREPRKSVRRFRWLGDFICVLESAFRGILKSIFDNRPLGHINILCEITSGVKDNKLSSLNIRRGGKEGFFFVPSKRIEAINQSSDKNNSELSGTKDTPSRSFCFIRYPLIDLV